MPLKTSLQNLVKNTRATIRAAIAIPFIFVAIGLAAVQAVGLALAAGAKKLAQRLHLVRKDAGTPPVVKAVGSFIPNLIYNGLRRILGYKIVLSEKSAAIFKSKQPVWYVANHMSIADFVVIGSKIDGTFAGKADILKWPGIGQLAQAIKVIGIKRSSDANEKTRGKLIEAFNNGSNVMMFPEGTTSEGSQVHLFRAALPSLLYGEKALSEAGEDVALQKDVMVQPLAIRVKAINGVDARGRDDLRNLYSMYEENHTLSRIWKRLQIRSTTIELTAFEPLDPKKFGNAMDLMNDAALKIASEVNPGQTAFVKMQIPGMACKASA